LDEKLEICGWMDSKKPSKTAQHPTPRKNITYWSSSIKSQWFFFVLVENAYNVYIAYKWTLGAIFFFFLRRRDVSRIVKVLDQPFLPCPQKERENESEIGKREWVGTTKPHNGHLSLCVPSIPANMSEPEHNSIHHTHE